MQNTNTKITKISKWNVNRTHRYSTFQNIKFESSFIVFFFIFIYSNSVCFYHLFDWTDSFFQTWFSTVLVRIDCVFDHFYFYFCLKFYVCFVVKFCWPFELFTYHNFSSTQHHVQCLCELWHLTTLIQVSDAVQVWQKTVALLVRKHNIWTVSCSLSLYTNQPRQKHYQLQTTINIGIMHFLAWHFELIVDFKRIRRRRRIKPTNKRTKEKKNTLWMQSFGTVTESHRTQSKLICMWIK